MQNHNSSLRDYTSGWEPRRNGKTRGKGLRWALLGSFSGLALGLFALTSFEANALRVKELPLNLPESANTVVGIPADSPSLALAIPEIPAAPVPEPGTWHEVTVASGDSLARIFSKHGLAARQLHDVLATGGIAKKLTQIYPGQKMRLRTTEEDGLLELLYEMDAMNQIQVVRKETGYDIQSISRVPDKRPVHATGRIDDSLFLAAQRSNLPNNITMELAGIFGWDIDFALDIREGDSFTVLYEELYLDDDRVGTGNILAAEFINNDKTYSALRYTDAQGRTDYYDPKGHSMRKTFLRTPVEFSRISSRFSTGRKHPVLNRIRAHKGVDYAAPTGTAVKAAGNGKIVLRGNKGGYGKTVVIQHGSSYSTLYAHLSRYSPGLKNGSRVQQGQIIGYVGSTGLATGPHLHYEFHVNGVHRNPLTVKLPDAAPLPEKYREQFRLEADNLLSQLELAKNQAVALQGD